MHALRQILVSCLKSLFTAPSRSRLCYRAARVSKRSRHFCYGAARVSKRSRHFRDSILVSVSLASACGQLLLADNTPLSRQQFRRSYALSAHGRIRIENRYGDVCITGWDRDEVRIEAIKSGGAGRLCPLASSPTRPSS